jgi:predicted Zn-dependent peptidase
MIDTKLFKKQQLTNGITCYTNPRQMDFTMVHIKVPVGTAHNTKPVLPGTFHFLEHICCQQSQQYPEPHAFGKAVGLTGGDSNAYTAPFATVYELSVPNGQIEALLPGLFSRVFEPYIEEATIQKQRDIITNERRRSERWYPARSEMGWYENTQWMKSAPYSLHQIFGGGDDLSAMDKQNLTAAHQLYFHTGIEMVSIGPADVSGLMSLLEALPTKTPVPAVEYDLLAWADKSYRVKRFRDASRYILTLGDFFQPVPDMQTVRQIRFILSYLVNTTHGALYGWLRHELGWAYNLSISVHDDKHQLSWLLEFPVNDLQQVETIRQQWRNKAVVALNDRVAIDQEVQRLLGASAYWNQDAESIFGSAMRDLDKHGRIVSDNEWRAVINECNNSQRLLQVFEQSFDLSRMGSYCAAPEETA